MKNLSKLISGDPKGDSGSGRENRSWIVSIPVAAVLVGVGVFLSAVINPLFGRYVHWDWMAILATTCSSLRLPLFAGGGSKARGRSYPPGSICH